MVSGATYSVKEIINGEPILEGKTEATNEQGELIIEDLYVGKTYEIKEEKSPEDYQLNTDKVRYTTNVDENGNLTVEKLQGVTKEEMTATKDEEEYKVAVKVEDEAKAKLKIVKKEKGTDNPVKWAYYQIEGTGISTQNIVTDSKGEAQISGLVVNEEYTLQEIKATGYYLASQIKFKIVNNDGNYEVQITE